MTDTTETTAPAPTPQVRLLRVHVQPVFAIDDGDLVERPGNPVVVSGKDWRAFGLSAFGAEDLAVIQQQLDATMPETPA